MTFLPKHVAPVALLALSCATTARAQTSDKALAEALFQDGRELFEKGETARACERFAASQKIEPKVGTLLNLATCHEKEGRTASAWAEFIEAETQASRRDQPDRAEFAKSHAQALGVRLSRISLHTHAGVEGVEIWVDGVRLGSGVEGTALPVDPGERTVEVKAPGKKSWTTRVSVPEGPSSTRIDIPELVATERARDAHPKASVGSPGPRDVRSDSGKKTAGWIVLGVGGVASGLGVVYGLHAIQKKSDADRECTGDACSSNGLAMHDDVKTSAAIATAAFSVGIAGLAVGAYLVLSSGGRNPVAAVLQPGPSGYAVRLHF